MAHSLFQTFDFDSLISVMDREPDFIIGDADDPYLRRWHLVPRNDINNVYLHEILKSDDDRALHDHPYDFESLILRGTYYEHVQYGSIPTQYGSVYRKGDTNYKRADTLHRIQVIHGPVITLVLTGPRKRPWGFQVGDEWIPWQDYEAQDDQPLLDKMQNELESDGRM